MDASNPREGNPSDGVTEETAEGVDDAADQAIREGFNISKFSLLAKRVLGEGEVDALKTLDKFRTRWREKFGFGGSGSVSTTMGSIVEVSSSPLHKECCGVLSSAPRVSGQHSLPRFSESPTQTPTNEDSQLHVASRLVECEKVHNEIYIGTVKLQQAEVPHADPIAEAFAKSSPCKSLGHDQAQCIAKAKERAPSKPLCIYVSKGPSENPPANKSVNSNRQSVEEGYSSQDPSSIAQEVVRYYEKLLGEVQLRLLAQLDFLRPYLTGLVSRRRQYT
ncbi:hypothetical protein Salat_1707900 [Sesamum alatum]|uniref:Uncharacterized protein n=1 Tax=Sesamum alatum TaxID=300844 RepID=A0AAE1Y7J4_9LAMI|nr:hypothetical protein Salat_1707900 [Sesamum alatum]